MARSRRISTRATGPFHTIFFGHFSNLLIDALIRDVFFFVPISNRPVSDQLFLCMIGFEGIDLDPPSPPADASFLQSMMGQSYPVSTA